MLLFTLSRGKKRSGWRTAPLINADAPTATPGQ
jgi:hypothetical protein